MQSVEFGRLVDAAIKEKRGVLRGSDEKRGFRNAVGRAVTKRLPLTDPRGLDSRQVGLVIEGKRHLDEELVQAFIDVLDLNPNEAWDASGIKRPDVTAEDYDLLDALRELRKLDDKQPIAEVYRHRSARRGSPTAAPVQAQASGKKKAPEGGGEQGSRINRCYSVRAAHRAHFRVLAHLPALRALPSARPPARLGWVGWAA